MNVIKVDTSAKEEHIKKACGYVRVSRDSLENINSFKQQMDYFENLIVSNNSYKFVGVFGDYAETGTNTNRPNFIKMIDLCKNGDIDLIMTKSISRFSRNTVDLLETLRFLRSINVDVYFEKENLHSLDMETEFILTILSSIAQNESKSISDNIKWGIRKNFEKGIPNHFIIYGYHWDENNFIVMPEEAKVVKHIFELYLSGKCTTQICKILKEEGVKTRNKKYFCNSSVARILSNIKYTGCLELQKEYIVDHLSHKRRKNNGELPKYLIYNHHEAIIDEDSFNKVQDIIKLRKDNRHLFSDKWYLGHLKCANCGSNFTAYNKTNGTLYFRCSGHAYKHCINKPITQKKLHELLTKYYASDDYQSLVKNDYIYITIDHDIRGVNDANN